jgi:hypothetical protein
MEEKKRRLWNGKPLSLLVKITLITFLIHPNTVSASEVALKTTGIPVPICFFLLLNVLQFSVATVMILEVKKNLSLKFGILYIWLILPVCLSH